MVAPASMGANSRAIAKASFDPSSRVPLSMAKRSSSSGTESMDQNTSSGPNWPTNSADVSRAPVRSSARSFKEGMQLAGYHVPKEAAYNVTIVQSAMLRSYRGL